MISAQTTEAFWNAVRACETALGGAQLLARPGPDVSVSGRISEKADVAISCYPNAGLPNPLSATGFDLGPPDMARFLGELCRGGLINIAGGCCGNTPEHIAAIAKALEGVPPRKYGRLGGRRRKRSRVSENKKSRCASPDRSPSRSSPASTS